MHSKRFAPGGTSRTFLHLLIGATIATAAALPAQAHAADAYPTRPLKLIVPFPPGGAADIVGRTIGAQLSQRLKQQVVIENRAGGGTVIAAELTARAPADGYTLSLATTGQLAINPHLHAKLPYDPIKDFDPVMIVARAPYLLSVNPKLPVRDAKEFVAHAKAQPGRLSYSSCGNGTVCHLSGELFKKTNGVHLVHIPYRGSAPAITAVAGGEVEVAFDTVTAQVGQARAGRIRPLVVSGARRSETLPDVPSAAEVGLPAFDADSWFGIVVPAGTPRDITQRLADELKQIAATPEVRATFARQGLETLSGTPAQFAEQIRRDQAKWGTIVKFSGARLD